MERSGGGSVEAESVTRRKDLRFAPKIAIRRSKTLLDCCLHRDVRTLFVDLDMDACDTTSNTLHTRSQLFSLRFPLRAKQEQMAEDQNDSQTVAG